MWRQLEVATGFTIPRGEEGGDMIVRCPITDLDGRSYQEWLIRLPVKLHGWGFRSLRETCGPAYLGALETAIPFMAARDMICPQMAAVWGGEESWAEGAADETRYRVLLQSGCQEGEELRRVWESLESRAREAAGWLDREVEEVFTSGIEAVGGGCVSGGTRGRIMEASEKTNSLVLSRALELHRPQKARHVWAWRQRDKLTTAWLLAIPGAESRLTNAEFSEAAAANLCLPSPACAGRVGEVIRGRVTIDKYGDNIQATSLPGDHWRKRHDAIKILLYRMCLWAGLPVVMEVFNLFSRYIPQEGLARINSGRKKQGMIPDLKIVLSVGGQLRPVLHEIKVISCSRSRYRPSWPERAVFKRAEVIHQEYVEKARSADQLYGGVAPGTQGPVERKLLTFDQVQGVVFGNFGEGSEAVHRLVDALATSRVRVAGPQRGRKGIRSEEGERSVVVGQIRRKLSLAAIKAQCSSLLGRLESLGPGSSAAAGRRREALGLARKWDRELEEYNRSVLQGRNVLRKGFGKVD